jgi:hypothetical protein
VSFWVKVLKWEWALIDRMETSNARMKSFIICHFLGRECVWVCGCGGVFVVQAKAGELKRKNYEETK